MEILLIEDTKTEPVLNASSVVIEKSAGIDLFLTKRQASLIFGLIKLAFEMQQNGEFPMSNESLLEIMPKWEEIAEKVDKLNGISQFHV